jgi:hypothetical protein
MTKEFWKLYCLSLFYQTLNLHSVIMIRLLITLSIIKLVGRVMVSRTDNAGSTVNMQSKVPK